MLNSIVSNIMQLRGFILVAAMGSLVVGAYLLLRCHSFSWSGRNRKIVGFFYQMGYRDLTGLAASLLKVFLMVSILVAGGRVELIHIGVFLMLELCFLARRRSVKNVVTDVAVGAISAGVLLVVSMLYHYLHEIYFDRRIACVVILLSVLLCIYALYDVFHYCCYIMDTRKKSGDTYEERENTDKQAE